MDNGKTAYVGGILSDMTIRIILPILLLLHCSAATANESFMEWQGGGMRPATTQTSIKMLSEVVNITFEKDGYVVDGAFSFENTGEETTVTMGFPMESGGVLFRDGLYGLEGMLEEPKTWVSGTEVAFVRASQSLEYYDPQEKKTLVETDDIETFRKQMLTAEFRRRIQQVIETAWYTKEVTFKEKENLLTRVRYKSRYGANSNPESFYAQYIYGSGKSWKGSIGKATFIIHTSPDVWMINYPNNQHPHRWRRHGEYEYILTMNDLEPNENDELTFSLSSTRQQYLIEGAFWTDSDEEFSTSLSLCSDEQLRMLRRNIRAEKENRRRGESSEPVNEEERKREDEKDEIRFRLVDDYRQKATKMNYCYDAISMKPCTE